VLRSLRGRLAALHDEVGELDKSERVLEELCVLQETVLKDAVAELGRYLDLFLLKQAVSYAHDRLLHFFSKSYATTKQVRIVMAEV